MINSDTIPSFIIGNPVSHSKSPLIHNAAFKKLKIDSVYLALHIEKNDFEQVITGLKKINIFGINITLPFKIDIMKHLDQISEEAKQIKSVNTIEIINKKWIGHNTDWFGVYKTLLINKIKKNHNALIIGAGGASPSVVYGLKKYKINNITVTNRTMSKAEDLQKHFNINILDYESLNSKISDYSFIINTTTLNFDALINKFDKETIYYDLKYYTAKLNINNFINGESMLLYQAIKAFEIWTKVKAPKSIMKKALEKI